MNLHVISTGSKGNCYLLTDDQGRVIALDAGVRISDTLRAIDHDISNLDGVLVTHEHMDHIKAAPILSNMGVPVYLSQQTIDATEHFKPDWNLSRPLPVTSDGRFDVFKVGNWYIQPFSVQHDAADPVGFLLANFQTHKILYATDTYYIKWNFTGLTHIIIECNYCTSVLMANIEAGKITGSRKDRLLHSHFSLENVLKFLKATDLSRCIKIVLVHLSDGNSDARQMVDAIYKQTGIETIAAEDGMDINFDLTPF